MMMMIVPARLFVLVLYRSSRSDSLQLMIFSVVLIVCCSFLFSLDEATPNQRVMADIRMQSIVIVWNGTSNMLGEDGEHPLLIFLVDKFHLKEETALTEELLRMSEEREDVRFLKLMYIRRLDVEPPGGILTRHC